MNVDVLASFNPQAQLPLGLLSEFAMIREYMGDMN